MTDEQKDNNGDEAIDSAEQLRSELEKIAKESRVPVELLRLVCAEIVAVAMKSSVLAILNGEATEIPEVENDGQV